MPLRENLYWPITPVKCHYENLYWPITSVEGHYENPYWPIMPVEGHSENSECLSTRIEAHSQNSECLSTRMEAHSQNSECPSTRAEALSENQECHSARREAISENLHRPRANQTRSHNHPSAAQSKPPTYWPSVCHVSGRGGGKYRLPATRQAQTKLPVDSGNPPSNLPAHEAASPV